jgi:hypothetical protein
VALAVQYSSAPAVSGVNDAPSASAPAANSNITFRLMVRSSITRRDDGRRVLMRVVNVVVLIVNCCKFW